MRNWAEPDSRGGRSIRYRRQSLHSQLVLLRSLLLCKQHGASIVITTVSRELFTAKHFCIYLNGASQMGSLILRLSYWQLRSCVWCGWSWDRDLLRGRDSGGWSWDGDLDNEPFLSFPSWCSWRQIISGPPHSAPGAEETETLAPI